MTYPAQKLFKELDELHKENQSKNTLLETLKVRFEILKEWSIVSGDHVFKKVCEDSIKDIDRFLELHKEKESK